MRSSPSSPPVSRALCHVSGAAEAVEGRHPYNDIAAVLGELEHLSAALGYYTRNIGYLRAQRLGAPRVDLDGNAAGSVSEEQAVNAQRALAGIRARQKEKAAAKPKQKAAKPPARDGLAALREAGRRRRAAE
jgi:ProP effector